MSDADKTVRLTALVFLNRLGARAAAALPAMEAQLAKTQALNQMELRNAVHWIRTCALIEGTGE